ncbi:MAG: sulfatase-like hydrolase/transferase [Candidatus Brocadiia bacterium]
MPESKNLIVFMAEGMPAKAIGAFGHPQIKTPNLDRLAGQSAVLHRTYCTQPVCTPGRASLFTGRYPHETCPDNEHNLPGSCFVADFSPSHVLLPSCATPHRAWSFPGSGLADPSCNPFPDNSHSVATLVNSRKERARSERGCLKNTLWLLNAMIS